jgi:hypothetical protein
MNFANKPDLNQSFETAIRCYLEERAKRKYREPNMKAE